MGQAELIIVVGLLFVLLRSIVTGTASAGKELEGKYVLIPDRNKRVLTEREGLEDL